MTRTLASTKGIARVAALAIGSCVFYAPTAQADGICGEANGLIEQAQSNFGDTHEGAPPLLTGASECALSTTLSGARAYHCAWEHDYRAARATQVFNEFVASFDACWGDRANGLEDVGVNHPDFYDLREYKLPGATVAVSLKDKGALQKTYVFVRVSAPAPK